MCLNNAGVRETEREGRAAGDTARDRVRDRGQEGWGQGARETESIRLELKLLKSNWSVGENEQREELNIFTKELMNRLKVFM